MSLREIEVTDADDQADLETLVLSADPEFLELIQNSRAHHAHEGGLSSTEMRRRLKDDLQDQD